MALASDQLFQVAVCICNQDGCNTLLGEMSPSSSAVVTSHISLTVVMMVVFNYT